MEVKIVKQNDKTDVKKLWADAFSEQEPFLSWYFDNFWKSENSLCAKNDEGCLLGALTLIPYDAKFSGKVYKTSYIAGVSVDKKFRNQGIAKTLMKSAILKQRERGETLSLLIPFNYDFYRKMGYEVCYERVEQKLNNTIKCEAFDVVFLDIENYSEMNSLYESFCEDKNGYIIRDKHSWEYILKRLAEQKTFAIGYRDCGKLLAYCVYTREKEKTVIHEIVGDNYSKEKLISYIFKTERNVFSIMPDFKNEKSEKKPTVMARITDSGAAFGKLKKSNVKIKITDDFIEENNGVFSPGSEIKYKSDEYDAEMDIKYFTQYFCSFKTCFELFEEGHIKTSEEVFKKLDDLIQRKDNYINLIMSEDF